MTFSPDLRRRGVRLLAPLLAMAALVAACGGGTSQVQSFVPARLLVVGDETGLIVDDGSHDGYRYTLNDRTSTTGAGKCLSLPTPAQTVAAYYGFVFAACNPNAAEAKAFAFGQAGALVEDATTGVKAQVDAIAGLGRSDMVMVTGGTNDVIDVYAQRQAGTLASDAAALAEAARRGTVLAGQINRILGTGARALVLTLPSLGSSPYAVAAEASKAGAASLIDTLTATFNAALRLGIDSTDFDGRNYGLVLVDDVTAAMVRFPTSYLASPANTTEAQCTTASLPQGCVVSDTVKNNTYLWASDRFLGPAANAQIGSQALSRAVNNPF
jgi:hypothetical protein